MDCHRNRETQYLAGAPGAVVSSNWAALKSAISKPVAFKRQNPAASLAATDSDDESSDEEADLARPEVVGNFEGVTSVVAVDCEMVGVGPTGERSALARCDSLSEVVRSRILITALFLKLPAVTLFAKR